jgi:hypothetical protein
MPPQHVSSVRGAAAFLTGKPPPPLRGSPRHHLIWWCLERSTSTLAKRGSRLKTSTCASFGSRHGHWFAVGNSIKRVSTSFVTITNGQFKHLSPVLHETPTCIVDARSQNAVVCPNGTSSATTRAQGTAPTEDPRRSSDGVARHGLQGRVG